MNFLTNLVIIQSQFVFLSHIKYRLYLIIVLYKDRLLRFGFELVEHFANLNNVKIEILDKIDKTEDEELVEDLVQIITVFSCKIQGKRKSKTKQILNEFSQKLKETIE